VEASLIRQPPRRTPEERKSPLMNRIKRTLFALAALAALALAIGAGWKP
jgi:hypothetical protein